MAFYRSASILLACSMWLSAQSAQELSSNDGYFPGIFAKKIDEGKPGVKKVITWVGQFNKSKGFNVGKIECVVCDSPERVDTQAIQVIKDPEKYNKIVIGQITDMLKSIANESSFLDKNKTSEYTLDLRLVSSKAEIWMEPSNSLGSAFNGRTRVSIIVEGRIVEKSTSKVVAVYRMFPQGLELGIGDALTKAIGYLKNDISKSFLP